MNNNTTSTTAQENTAHVATNNELSTAVQQPAVPAPADAEMIETTFTDDKEQAPAAAPADEKKPKKHRNVEHCKVDFDKKAIIITKEFAKKASIIDTPEFNRLSDLCRAYPHLKVITRTAKKSTTRPSMKGLTKDFMEKHIKTLHNADWNLYLRQQAISEAFKCPHMYMRKWFTKRYPAWSEYVVQQ